MYRKNPAVTDISLTASAVIDVKDAVDGHPKLRNAWRNTVSPSDFQLFDFTEMEDNTRALSHIDDEWVLRPIESPVHVMEASLAETQSAIDSWWIHAYCDIHGTIAPFVKNYIYTHDVECSGSINPTRLNDWYYAALLELATNGCKSHQQFDRAALGLSEDEKDKYAGRPMPNIVKWGEKIQCVDYSSQSIQIGALHFTLVDLGDTITLSTSTQKALRVPIREETNQCLALHIAAAEWKYLGCPKRVPNRSRVDALASHVRKYEYKQASAFATHVETALTKREFEPMSVAHDAMSPHHDHQFRELIAFLSGIVDVGIFPHLRIFEI